MENSNCWKVLNYFWRTGTEHEKYRQAVESQLYEEIGRLKVELDWLKRPNLSIETKRELIELWPCSN